MINYINKNNSFTFLFKKIKRILSIKKKNNTGRNNTGKIIFKHRGFRYRRYFYLNQKNLILNLKCIFISFFYNSYLNTFNGIFLYENRIITIEKVTADFKKGDVLNSYISLKNDVTNLYSLYKSCLFNLTIGTIISNIEIYTGKGAQINKAAGTYSQIINIFEFYNYKTLVLLNSKIEYLLNSNNFCLIGPNINKNFFHKKKKKAGQNRWIGKRPHVRGVAMNPIDHPHGGGQGKTSGGRCSVTPFGLLTKGRKTKKYKRMTSFIKQIKKKLTIKNNI